MISSPSSVREPEGDGCAERLIRSWKEHLLGVRTFQTVEQLRLALLQFKEIHNEQRTIQRIGYKTPSQTRRNACKNPRSAA
ncbi:MAG: integrase core domain-containing protein [Planctomycetota bacterium]